MDAIVPPAGGCRVWDAGAEPIVLGLVNNMPDAAFASTERQYRELLSAASGGQPIRLRLFNLPQVPRSEAARAQIAFSYESVEQLWDADLDGLIVSGAEPRAHSLRDEPYWPALAELVDWAEEHTLSAVWSCLAAQAAVLHADGIVRRPFGYKLSGVFAATRTVDHALTAGLPPCWRVPQTRHNDLPEQALTPSGYRILSRLTDAGADMFIREGRSLFVLLQGHPEYGPDMLLREYRRDVARFLAGERDTYPDPMHGYFDERTEASLQAFRTQALRTREPALIDRLPAALDGWMPVHDWHEPAIKLYANWLRHLAQRKDQNAGRSRPREDAMAGGVAVMPGP